MVRFNKSLRGLPELRGPEQGGVVADEFDLRELSLDRRSFLRRGAAGGIGVALLGTGGMSAILAACGSSSKPSSSGPTTTVGGVTDLGELTFQLSWIKNVEFAGEYIADTNGYYKGAGFSKVTLLSGGPGVAQDSIVAAGKALVCISAPDITSSAIKNGAPLVTIGAQYQKNPFAIMSLANKPIKTPQDMIGKKIGVQATNEAVWNAFLKANNIDPGSITKVPVQFDPTPLTTGEVDGWFSFITNEPNDLKASTSTRSRSFSPTTATRSCRRRTWSHRLAHEQPRDKIKAMLVAEIKGWKDT